MQPSAIIICKVFWWLILKTSHHQDTLFVEAQVSAAVNRCSRTIVDCKLQLMGQSASQPKAKAALEKAGRGIACTRKQAAGTDRQLVPSSSHGEPVTCQDAKQKKSKTKTNTDRACTSAVVTLKNKFLAKILRNGTVFPVNLFVSESINELERKWSSDQSRTLQLN